MIEIYDSASVYLGRSRKPKVFKPWDECDSFNLDS